MYTQNTWARKKGRQKSTPIWTFCRMLKFLITAIRYVSLYNLFSTSFKQQNLESLNINITTKNMLHLRATVMVVYCTKILNWTSSISHFSFRYEFILCENPMSKMCVAPPSGRLTLATTSRPTLVFACPSPSHFPSDPSTMTPVTQNNILS